MLCKKKGIKVQNIITEKTRHYNNPMKKNLTNQSYEQDHKYIVSK